MPNTLMPRIIFLLIFRQKSETKQVPKKMENHFNDTIQIPMEKKVERFLNINNCEQVLIKLKLWANSNQVPFIYLILNVVAAPTGHS